MLAAGPAGEAENRPLSRKTTIQKKGESPCFVINVRKLPGTRDAP